MKIPALRLLALVALGACGGDSDYGGSTPPSSDMQVALRVEQVFAGLPAFATPVAMLQAPGSAARWFVVEQAGRVRVFANSPLVSATAVFVDIAPRVNFVGETGLLGMAFHPQFPTDPRAYLFYSHNDATLGLMSRLSEFSTTDGGATLDQASERILMTIRKPDGEDNHNGGSIAFGPDGFLYAGIGDGGGGNDQHGTIGNAQATNMLLGKMLRVDVSGGTGSFLYRIPSGNPFAGNALSGASVAAGRGIRPRRRHRGDRRLRLPRQRLAALAGRYVFGDFTIGRIFNIAASTPPTLTLTTGFASGLNISSFAEAIDGELYVVDYGGGLYRIAP